MPLISPTKTNSTESRTLFASSTLEQLKIISAITSLIQLKRSSLLLQSIITETQSSLVVLNGEEGIANMWSDHNFRLCLLNQNSDSASSNSIKPRQLIIFSLLGPNTKDTEKASFQLLAQSFNSWIASDLGISVSVSQSFTDFASFARFIAQNDFF